MGLPEATGDQRARVLVVEDDDDVAALVREILSDAGYAVAAAINGAAALAILTTYEPAVIVVDLRMPVMDGRAFIERYRGQGGRARIILLTAAREVGSTVAIRGVDVLLAKPFELEALHGAVAGLVNAGARAIPADPVTGGEL